MEPVLIFEAPGPDRTPATRLGAYYQLTPTELASLASDLEAEAKAIRKRLEKQF